MGRLSNEAKAKMARQSLINTIAKIHDLEPTLGLKWRDKMLVYYQKRLAELLLYQLGFRQPSWVAVETLADQIGKVLEEWY